MLMTAHIAPCSFWMTLLTDALPLLEQKEVNMLVGHDRHPTAFLFFLTSYLKAVSPPQLSAPKLGFASDVLLVGIQRTQFRIITHFPALRK